MIVLGIDPGLTGAVASIDGDGDVIIWDTPTAKVKKGKGFRNEYLPSEMATLLSAFKNCHVFIEAVHSMPKQGVSSSFNFGMGYGLWLGIIGALKMPHSKVTPQRWKKVIMQGIADKDAARMRAMELFPEHSKFLARKKDDGRAEALLLAEFGRRVMNEN